MDKPAKCAHEPCQCVVSTDDFGDYCSAHCQDASSITELRCECGHEACMETAP